MTAKQREKSDAYLQARWPRPLTDEEHRVYALLCLEEGSLDTGEGIADHLLDRLRRKREDKAKG